MSYLLGCVIGLVLGWFSYRYQGAFVDIVVGIAGFVGLLVNHGGPALVKSAMTANVSAGAGPAFRALAELLSHGIGVVLGIGVGMFVGRLLTHVYWRCVRVGPEVTPESERARVIAHYGYSDPQDARLNAKRKR